MKKLIILFKLFFLTIIKKNHSKAEVIRKANIFKEFGGWGTGILVGFLRIQN